MPAPQQHQNNIGDPQLDDKRIGSPHPPSAAGGGPTIHRRAAEITILVHRVDLYDSGRYMICKEPDERVDS